MSWPDMMVKWRFHTIYMNGKALVRLSTIINVFIHVSPFSFFPWGLLIPIHRFCDFVLTYYPLYSISHHVGWYLMKLDFKFSVIFICRWFTLKYKKKSLFSNIDELNTQLSSMTPEERVDYLQNALKGHILRRLKHDVIKSLPKKTEVIVPLSLTSLQKWVF